MSTDEASEQMLASRMQEERWAFRGLVLVGVMADGKPLMFPDRADLQEGDYLFVCRLESDAP